MLKIESWISKFFAQEIHEPRVLFQREQTRAAFQNLFRQRTEPGSNFQNKIIRLDLSLIDDPARQILIVQKILAERFDRSHASLVERGAGLRKVHPRIGQESWKTRILFTKSCEQIAEKAAGLYTSYSPPRN